VDAVATLKKELKFKSVVTDDNTAKVSIVGAGMFSHPGTAARLGLVAGGQARVRSRRGAVTLSVRLDDGMPLDTAFIPFAYAEAAANRLTNPALDPFGKIPEFKYCAVKIMRGGELTPRSSYGGGQAMTALEKA